MKIVLDYQLVNILVHNPSKLIKNPLLSHTDTFINFKWPSLLEYLELGSLFSQLPSFDQTQPLFEFCISTLHAGEEKDVLFDLYDRLFLENLNQIKTLAQINASFLLHAIKKQRGKSSFSAVEKVLSATLAAHERALQEKVSDTMHDLILYLAWDRMCVCVAQLFNYPSTDSKFIKGIDILKECLIESYQHIAQQGRTSPGIYRLMEALFFYDMREENIKRHTDAEWAMLSESFPALKAQNEMSDFFYIDDAVGFEKNRLVDEKNSLCFLTLDSPERVHCRLALAHFMMDKLKREVPMWGYHLQPQKIIHINILENVL